jgi:hypothetical protein
MREHEDARRSARDTVVRGLKLLVLGPDRSGSKVPDNSWAASGCPAEALVTEARWTKRRLGDPPSHFQWAVQLRVRPATEAEFDVTVEDWFRAMESPAPGQVVHVVYDPASHERTIVDHRSDSDREAGIGTAGPANDDETMANMKWGETATPGDVLMSSFRAVRGKTRDLRDANKPPAAES